MLRLILLYGHKGREALSNGAQLSRVLSLPIRDDIARTKYLSEKELSTFEAYEQELNNQVAMLSEEGELNA